jgi:hypothetical protein
MRCSRRRARVRAEIAIRLLGLLERGNGVGEELVQQGRVLQPEPGHDDDWHQHLPQGVATGAGDAVDPSSLAMACRSRTPPRHAGSRTRLRMDAALVHNAREGEEADVAPLMLAAPQRDLPRPAR